MDASKVADLRRRFSGLNEDLTYIKGQGHTIETKYLAYKKAHEKAQASNTAYSNLAKSEKKAKGPDFTGPVRQGYYTQANHQELARLADTAAQHAKEHADRRDSFNQRYKEVLEAASVLNHAADPARYRTPNTHWEGHVEGARIARKSQATYTGLHGKHMKYA